MGAFDGDIDSAFAGDDAAAEAEAADRRRAQEEAAEERKAEAAKTRAALADRLEGKDGEADDVPAEAEGAEDPPEEPAEGAEASGDPEAADAAEAAEESARRSLSGKMIVLVRIQSSGKPGAFQALLGQDGEPVLFEGTRGDIVRQVMRGSETLANAARAKEGDVEVVPIPASSWQVKRPKPPEAAPDWVVG